MDLGTALGTWHPVSSERPTTCCIKRQSATFYSLQPASAIYLRPAVLLLFMWPAVLLLLQACVSTQTIPQLLFLPITPRRPAAGALCAQKIRVDIDTHFVFYVKIYYTLMMPMSRNILLMVM
jgi:hypothetical protein